MDYGTFKSISHPPISRRRFLKASLGSATALALYSGELERHRIEITRHEIPLRGLPEAFDGYRIVQLSDIHMDEFTEPFFLRRVVEEVNQLHPDAIFLTGDYVSYGVGFRKIRDLRGLAVRQYSERTGMQADLCLARES